MPINSRQKGKRIERAWATDLREFFPGIRRNAGTQAQSGGRDLENTGDWSWEIKGGKGYKSKMVRDFLNQAKEEAKGKPYPIVGVSPDREDPYIIMGFEDFKKIMRLLINKTDNLTS